MPSRYSHRIPGAWGQLTHHHISASTRDEDLKNRDTTHTLNALICSSPRQVSMTYPVSHHAAGDLPVVRSSNSQRTYEPTKPLVRCRVPSQPCAVARRSRFLNITLVAPTIMIAVVICGGPGWAAARRRVSRAGQDACSCSKGIFPRFHIGESLCPPTTPLFRENGCAAQLPEPVFAEAGNATLSLSNGSVAPGRFGEGRFNPRAGGIHSKRHCSITSCQARRRPARTCAKGGLSAFHGGLLRRGASKPVFA